MKTKRVEDKIFDLGPRKQVLLRYLQHLGYELEWHEQRNEFSVTREDRLPALPLPWVTPTIILSRVFGGADEAFRKDIDDMLMNFIGKELYK